MFRHFGFSGLLTAAAIITAFIMFGSAGAVAALVLIAIEVAFSFDNAILNAKILERLPPLWRKLFLTVGMVIAILGMRFIFPIAIVAVTAHLSWRTVIDDALYHPAVYADYLHNAHASIAAFGGAFLLTLTFYFFLDHKREILWLDRLERPLQRLGGAVWIAPLAGLIVVSGAALLAPASAVVMQAGVTGVLSYVALKVFIDVLARLTGDDSKQQYSGWGALLAFLYLELLDASFSFDGVLGAFAITDKVILIALGLGVGAIWVRSLTVWLVEKGTLSELIYLEHGAHYAILVLAVALLSSVFFEIPDAVTGVVGLGVIGASYIASREVIRSQSAHKAASAPS
ncbi:MAG: DUF475 domain-containing protein [Candidatus Saccharibacteria bacterium]